MVPVSGLSFRDSSQRHAPMLSSPPYLGGPRYSLAACPANPTDFDESRLREGEAREKARTPGLRREPNAPKLQAALGPRRLRAALDTWDGSHLHNGRPSRPSAARSPAPHPSRSLLGLRPVTPIPASLWLAVPRADWL